MTQFFLTQPSHDRLKRVTDITLGPRPHLAARRQLISPGDPEIVRLGKLYGGAAAATYTGKTLQTPTKCEVLLHRLRADGTAMEAFETDPEVGYWILDQAGDDGQEVLCLRDRSINDPANPNIAQPGWIAYPAIAASGWREKPIELYDVNQASITTDDVTALKWDFARNWDTAAYLATSTAGGAPAEWITLQKRGLYRIGFNLQFTTAGTSGAGDGWGSTDLVFILGRAFITADSGGGDAEVVNTSAYLSLTYNHEIGAFNAGNASGYTWFQRGANATKLKLKVDDASHATQHPFEIGGNFWAVWCDHDVTPNTDIASD